MFVEATLCLRSSAVETRHTRLAVTWDTRGTVATYVCDHGHYFTEGSTVRTLTCNNVTWPDLQPDCTGKILAKQEEGKSQRGLVNGNDTTGPTTGLYIPIGPISLPSLSTFCRMNGWVDLVNARMQCVETASKTFCQRNLSEEYLYHYRIQYIQHQ